MVSRYAINVVIVMDAINKSGVIEHTYPVSDTLFFKIQGSPESIKLAAKEAQTITKKHSSSQFVFAKTDEEADDLWRNRKHALTSSIAYAGPGAKCWTTDVW